MWYVCDQDDSSGRRPIWYVGYGSNLSESRFLSYLTGGRVEGSTLPDPGARDPTPPSANRVVQLDGSLWFGGESRKWHGGVAHLDVRPNGGVLGRAWRLERGQLEDLAAQEMGMATGQITLTDDVIEVGGVIDVRSRYGRVVPLAQLDGVPAVTFTFASRPEARRPSLDYLSTMVAGLRECGLEEHEVTEYLSKQPKVSKGLVSAARKRLDTAL